MTVSEREERDRQAGGQTDGTIGFMTMINLLRFSPYIYVCNFSRLTYRLSQVNINNVKFLHCGMCKSCSFVYKVPGWKVNPVRGLLMELSHTFPYS